jgi:Uma2 family endonuclease
VRLVTAEDLLRYPTAYEHGELWDGRWMAGEASGGSAEIAGSRVHVRLGQVVEERHLGWVTGSNQGFFLRRDPDRVLCPDVAFTSFARLPRAPARSFIDGAPNFAVEVVSPTDRWETVVKKAGVWIAHDVEVVWVIDPLTRRVAVVRQEGPVELLVGDGVASAEPAVPGFSIALADLFRDLPTAD